MTFNMVPVEVVDDAVRGCFADMKSTSQFATLYAESRQTSDLGDLGIVQFGSTILISSSSDCWKNASTLVLPIPVIIRDSSEEEMVDIDTCGIVTRMANTFTRWINSGMNKVRKAMGMPRLSGGFHQSVPLCKLGSLPVPALGWSTLLNMFPEVVQGNWGH